MCRLNVPKRAVTFGEIQGWLNEDQWFDDVFSESVDKQTFQQLLFDISKAYIAATENEKCRNSFKSSGECNQVFSGSTRVAQCGEYLLHAFWHSVASAMEIKWTFHDHYSCKCLRRWHDVN